MNVNPNQHPQLSSKITESVITNRANRAIHKETIMNSSIVRQTLSAFTVNALCACAFLLTSVDAAIIVDDSGGYALASVSSSHTVTSGNLGGFNANGSDKLVVTVTNERSGTSNNTVSTITYGGVALTNAIADTSSSSVARRLSIWYLDNVTVTGDIVVSYVQSASGIGISAVALSGTVADFADAATNGGVSTAGADGGFVIAAGIANGGAISADAPLIGLLSSADGDTGSSTGAAGYYNGLLGPGSFTPSFSGDETFVTVMFDAVEIPEPSTAILAGLGLMGLVLRRRWK
ncbi:MAG: PEP-CTERM sorting domain-containing protein [Lentisphaeria bacterium]|nr:PEP-CTERM sorting domain-containing protein [Lentisphaeria bacterium]